MPSDLSGKRAVVTGGSSGIGLATARALAEGGAEVWIFDLERPTDFAGQFLPVDVTDDASISAALDKAGAPDIVIANAGTGSQADLTDTSRDLWDRIIALNLTGVFQTVQAAALLMKPRRSGSIVLTASTNSYDGEARLTAYNASKAGVLGILHTAANELGPFGIRVNAVCPGLIRTRLTQRLFENPTYLRNYFQHIPLGRGGEPEEVAAAIAFLASDLASYISGAALLVDGGQMATKFGTWDETNSEFADGRWRIR
jgi:NAD(P)-dependent dehydrogenase (short-subunit alcohol dehydrogenase family)